MMSMNGTMKVLPLLLLVMTMIYAGSSPRLTLSSECAQQDQDPCISNARTSACIHIHEPGISRYLQVAAPLFVACRRQAIGGL